MKEIAMELCEIGANFFVSPQIEPHDIASIKEKGIKTIICNRPDGEDIGQTPFETIAKTASDYGISCYYLPVSPPHIMPEDVQEMIALLQDAQYPILAYCRSGTRSTYLYQLAKNI